MDSPEQLTTRRDVRERAMQVLYAYELSQEPIEMLVESIAGEDIDREPGPFSFAQRLIYTVLNHRHEADPLIRKHARNWDFDRIATIDKIILRMGFCEFVYFGDVPVKVTINEYVELGKKFSTENSGRFLNGMLDAILTDIKSQNLVTKAGRGLIDL
jgi:N utilization substance protein B